MRLRYFESKNFGDALNPHLFNKLLPGFFNDNPAIDFIGIGSILGFDMARTSESQIVFNSGFALRNQAVNQRNVRHYSASGAVNGESALMT